MFLEKELLNKSTFKFQYLISQKRMEYIEVEFSNELVENSVPYNIFYLIEISLDMFPIIPPRVYCLTKVDKK